MRFYIYLILACLLASCLGSIGETYEFEADFSEFKHELAIPLFKNFFTMEDALSHLGEQDEVNIGEDQFITLGYLNTLKSETGAEAITLDPFEFPMPDSMMLIPHGLSPSIVPAEVFEIENGELRIEFLSGHQEDLMVKFSIQEIQTEGNVLEKEIAVVYPGAIPISIDETIDLKDHEIDLSSGNYTVAYSAVNANGDPRLLGQVKLSFSEQQCKRVVASALMDATFELPNEGLALGLFEGQDPGKINFENPRMELNINNSYGFPIKFFFGEIIGKNTNGDSVILQTNMNDGIDLAFPDINNEGGIEKSTLVFDIDNSNIRDLINIAPEEIIFNSYAETESFNDPNTPVFGLAESMINTDLVLEVPVYAAVQQLSVEEVNTFNFNREDIKLEGAHNIEIESLDFKLNADNNMPVGIQYQVYFENDAGEVLDSLFSGQNNFINAAEVNNEGVVINNSFTVLEESISGDRLDAIDNATHLRTKNTLTSDDFKSVKFFSTNGIDMELGLIVKLNVE